jgi:hypothetical protein
VVVRARASKVDLGAAPARTQPDGWVEAQFGQHTSAAPALIEMRSRVGNVNFAFIE